MLPQNIHCGYTLEPPRRGGSNEYPQSIGIPLHTSDLLYKGGGGYKRVYFKTVMLS